MMRCALLLMFAPLAAQAQLLLFSVNGTAETPVGSTYQVGSVAAGDSKDTRFRARNTSSGPINVTNLAISGSGFSIIQTPSVPFAIAPGFFQDIYVHFSGLTPTTYSANFQLKYGGNSITVLLLASVVAAPSLATLAAGNGCTGPDASTNAIAFGTVQDGQTATCTISLQNLGIQSLTVSTVTLTGTGFIFANSVHTPIVISPGGSFSLTITFAPSAAAVYAGVLAVDTRTYPLSGTGFSPPLPTPILDFDPGAPASAQQRTLTMRLAAPSPVAATGSVLLSFRPGATVVADDPAVMFVATGARSVPFSIKAGDTQFLLGGQSGAVFQTGTTAGNISFSVSTNVTVNGTASASMSIPAAPIGIDKATATTRAGDLDVQVWGFDNTYSAGAMSFTFYDLSGKVVQPGVVSADFSQQFRAYFTAGATGSSFQRRVSFPVTGDSTQIGAVDVQLTNSAGSVAIQHLNFQP